MLISAIHPDSLELTRISYADVGLIVDEEPVAVYEWGALNQSPFAVYYRVHWPYQSVQAFLATDDRMPKEGILEIKDVWKTQGMSMQEILNTHPLADNDGQPMSDKFKTGEPSPPKFAEGDEVVCLVDGASCVICEVDNPQLNPATSCVENWYFVRWVDGYNDDPEDDCHYVYESELTPDNEVKS